MCAVLYDVHEAYCANTYNELVLNYMRSFGTASQRAWVIPMHRHFMAIRFSQRIVTTTHKHTFDSALRKAIFGSHTYSAPI